MVYSKVDFFVSAHITAESPAFAKFISCSESLSTSSTKCL